MTDAKLRQVKEKIKQINTLSRAVMKIMDLGKEVKPPLEKFEENETVRLKNFPGKWVISQIDTKNQNVLVKDRDGEYKRHTQINQLIKLK